MTTQTLESPTTPKPLRVGLVTLGCDKNTVDNEYLAGLLSQRGMKVEVANPASPPDVIVITTCGFIQSARDQSMAAIREWSKVRARTGARLGVIGCLAQRNGEEIMREVPGIDFLAGVGQFDKVARMVAGDTRSAFLEDAGPDAQPWNLARQSAAIADEPGHDHGHDHDHDDKPAPIEFDDRAFAVDAPRVIVPRTLPRQRVDKRPHGFLKISDGCNHTCTFCSIPLMKGIYTSVPRQTLLDETRRLLDDGVREINIVAQDITKYGLDTEKRLALPDLLNDLCAIEGHFWLRLFYLYPSTVTKDLIAVIKQQPKIARYLDIPLQHLDGDVLRRMKRPHDRDRTMGMLRMLRSELPEMTLRTTFIVGFPGETPAEFDTLVEGVEEIRFERMGVFVYSKEEGTPAAALPNQVTEKVKHRRREKLMKRQAEISAQWAADQVGTTREVLIEGRVGNGPWHVGRSHSEAADIDGVVRVYSTDELKPGTFVTAKVIEADTYDLTAECLAVVDVPAT